jgi:hypothetical protein
MQEVTFRSPEDAKRWIGERRIREHPPVYDIRGDVVPRAHYGESLWAGEVVTYALGLRTGYYEGPYAYIMGLQWYFDARDPERQEEFQECIKDLVQKFHQALTEWEDALRDLAPPGEGGSVLYRPVAIAVSNFGGSVIGDTRTERVRRFRL